MSEWRDTKAAAVILGLVPGTLENWRGCGRGPVFYKVGGRVLYKEVDLREWLAGRRAPPLPGPAEGSGAGAT